jgi:hypothetical protein
VVFVVKLVVVVAAAPQAPAQDLGVCRHRIVVDPSERFAAIVLVRHNKAAPAAVAAADEERCRPRADM